MKFSVTIPAYKAHYLKEAIDSVLAQTYQDYEIIIVNDASPFNVDEIVSQFVSPRICYFKNEKNCGAKDVVDNWNICLEHVSGDYVICMGDDDKLCPNCLQDFADAIDKYPDVNIFHAGTEIIDEQSNHVETLEIRPEQESVYSLIYSTQGSGLGSYLYKTSILRKNGGFYKLPYGWASDFISEYIAAKDNGIINIQTVGFQYRGNGLSISHDMESILDKIQALLQYEKWINDFLMDNKPILPEDKVTAGLIKNNLEKRIHSNIDGLVEFDIRLNFVKRSWFWLKNKSKFGISSKRYIKCVLNSLRYRIQ